jgi:hypothetical protein
VGFVGRVAFRGTRGAGNHRPMDGAPAQPRFAEISTAFPTVPESVAAARRFVAASLRRFEFSDDACERAILATSELVAHAFTAGRPPIRIRVRSISDRKLAVEVTHARDDDAPLPREVELELTTAGRAVVDSMASRWGARPAGGGVMAWFEIEDVAPVRPTSPASAAGGI